MGTRSDALAERIEQGASAMIAFADGLSEEQWQTIVPNEQRSVGVLIHHVASSYQVEVDLAGEIAAGNPIAGITMDALDHMNAQHAAEHQSVGKEETLQLLRENSKVAAERVRNFTDSQLDSAATISLNADAPLTAQFFIEDHALRHSFHHLASMMAALEPSSD